MFFKEKIPGLLCQSDVYTHTNIHKTQNIKEKQLQFHNVPFSFRVYTQYIYIYIKSLILSCTDFALKASCPLNSSFIL